MAGPETTRQKVRTFLDELSIGYVETDHDTLIIEAGTTAVYITVETAGDRDVVTLFAPVLSEVDAPAERLAEVLALNSELRFGKFSWLPDRRTIAVEYELLGDFLDREELCLAVEAVGGIADTCDVKLQPILGGRLPHRDP